MRIYGIVATGLVGLTIAGHAPARGQQFETPMYTTANPGTLDRNYGLPKFGMPGSELSAPPTPAPVALPADKPASFRDTPDFPTSSKRKAGKTEVGMETPLYTTSDGSTDSDFVFGTIPSDGKTRMETDAAR